MIDSGISAARKSGKLQEAKDLFYQALLSCDAKSLRAIPYDLFLAGMSLEMIFNESDLSKFFCIYIFILFDLF